MNEFYNSVIKFGACLLFGLLCASCASPGKPQTWLDIDCDESAARIQSFKHAQLEAYLGSKDVAGIPLLDPEIDWFNFSNWPDEFQFGGETYMIQLTDTTGIDYFLPIRNRSEIKPDAHFLVRYAKADSMRSSRSGTIQYPDISPSASFAKDGRLYAQHLNAYPKNIYGLQYFPDGKVSYFQRTDFRTGNLIREYYDKSGCLVGLEVFAKKASDGGCWINGKKVSSKTFHDTISRMRNGGDIPPGIG